MSRAFVKEDDQEENPIIPNRAPLPEGVLNYVTPEGYQALQNELEELEGERNAIPTEETPEKRAAFKVVNGKINMLLERINSAELVEIPESPPEEIRFGAHVTFRFKTEKADRTFQIVGVDEADVKAKKIGFTSPIARVLLGKKAGDIAELKLAQGTREIHIKKVSY